MSWTYSGTAMALIIGAFFLVNLVPYPHTSTSSGVTTTSVVGSFQAHELSIFGFNTPGLPAWSFDTSTAILILAMAAFIRDGYDFIDEHH